MHSACNGRDDATVATGGAAYRRLVACRVFFGAERPRPRQPLHRANTHAAPTQVFVSGTVAGAMDAQHFWYVNKGSAACASVAHTNLGRMLGTTGPDDDVQKGTQVVIANASGTVVGVARLGPGSVRSGDLRLLVLLERHACRLQVLDGEGWVALRDDPGVQTERAGDTTRIARRNFARVLGRVTTGCLPARTARRGFRCTGGNGVIMRMASRATPGPHTHRDKEWERQAKYKPRD